MVFTVSAPGKTILFGEHAVVYGVPAIAASVALHTFITVEEGATSHFLELDFPGVSSVIGRWELDEFERANLVKEAPAEAEIRSELDPVILEKARDLAASSISSENSFMRTAATAFLYLYITIFLQAPSFKRQGNLRFNTTGTLPIGAGLGSSASFTVCVAAALLKASGRLTDQTPHDEAMNLVTKWSFLGESCIHGKPSGIDNVVATRGGAVLFQRSKPDETHAGGPAIKPYTRFPELGLILTDTQVGRHTSDLVAKVAEIKKNWPTLFSTLMSSFQEIVEQADLLLKNPESVPDFADKVGELADINHGLLTAIGVSHPALELVRETSKKLGLGRTKLTGAGGGGCAITITNELRPDIAEFRAQMADFRVFVTKLGGHGVGWVDASAETPKEMEHLDWHYW